MQKSRGGLIVTGLIVTSLASLLSGCSVYMAANQPGEKNLALLKPGTPRNAVVAEFGTPITSETKNGVKHDVIKFTQGYSAGARAGRAILHGAADVFTAGLWEVAGTPVESTFNGTQMSAEVVYDASDRIAQIIPLSHADEFNAGVAGASGSAPKKVETSSISKPLQQP